MQDVILKKKVWEKGLQKKINLVSWIPKPPGK